MTEYPEFVAVNFHFIFCRIVLNFLHTSLFSCVVVLPKCQFHSCSYCWCFCGSPVIPVLLQDTDLCSRKGLLFHYFQYTDTFTSALFVALTYTWSCALINEHSMLTMLFTKCNYL